MTSPEAERRMMEDALSRREVRNTTAPPVWTGGGSAAPAPKDVPRADYTPEGF